MTFRLALLALLVWGGLARAQTPPEIRLVDPGPGDVPRMLARALAGPHLVVAPIDGRAVLPHDATYRQTVIALGQNIALDGRVIGDLIVVGGDLHIHPHAEVTGKAIAIGGAVYASAMATVGATESYREFMYEIVRRTNLYSSATCRSSIGLSPRSHGPASTVSGSRIRPH